MLDDQLKDLSPQQLRENFKEVAVQYLKDRVPQQLKGHIKDMEIKFKDMVK